MRHEAVSEVVGALVLVGIAVLGVSILMVVLFANPLPTRVPSFYGLISNSSRTVYISHEGGDPLYWGQYKILVDSVDETWNFTKSLPDANRTFSHGTVMNATLPRIARRVVMVFNSSWGGGTVLLSADLVRNVVPAPAPYGWYDSGWLYRKKITIDHTDVPSDQSDFPVLISIPDVDLSAHAQHDSDDILFTASDGMTKLSHEIELYTWNSGTLVAWVKVPALSSATDTVIYLYYGSDDPTNQQDPTNVWDSHYVAVWHLKESGTGAPGEFKDSTRNGINGQGGAAGGCPTMISNGAVGPAQSFDGSNDNISMGTSTLLQPSELTCSYWISRTGSWNGIQRRFFWAKGALETGNGWYIDVTGAANRPINLGTNQAGWLSPVVAPDTFYSLNTWTYMVVTFSTTADVAQSYKNAVALGMTSWGTLPTAITSTTDPKFVGMGLNPAVTYVQGNFDELRISDIVRSPNWITTEYNNMKTPGVGGFLVSISTEQTSTTMS